MQMDKDNYDFFYTDKKEECEEEEESKVGVSS